jgi:hypothetical protein
MTRPRRLESATCPLSPAPTPGLPESPHASSRAKQAWLLAKTKSGQTEQNPAKPEQRKSKKDGWISLVSHVHFEPFQRVTATPPRQKIFLALLPPRPPRWPRLVRRRGQNIMDSVFRKEKVDARALPGRDRALAQAGSPVDPRAPTIVSSSPQFNAIDGFASHFPPQWIAYRLFRAIIMGSRRVGPGVGRQSHVC